MKPSDEKALAPRVVFTGDGHEPLYTMVRLSPDTQAQLDRLERKLDELLELVRP